MKIHILSFFSASCFQAKSIAPFLHPSEVQLLEKIVEVMENFRKIEDYIKSVRTNSDPGM